VARVGVDDEEHPIGVAEAAVGPCRMARVRVVHDEPVGAFDPIEHGEQLSCGVEVDVGRSRPQHRLDGGDVELRRRALSR
jgi:hypothetical protein